MQPVHEMLTRPGLDPTVRVLVATKVAVGGAHRERLAACARAARQHGMPRPMLEETLLQAVLFHGFPRVVTAFEVLAREWPPTSPPRGGSVPPADRSAAGRALFARIYGDNADAVAEMLRSFHEELAAFVLEAAYGRILSRPGLEPAVRELLAVGTLADLEQIPQLVAHARGALSLGAADGEVREAMWTAWDDHARVEEAMRKVLGRRSG